MGRTVHLVSELQTCLPRIVLLAHDTILHNLLVGSPIHIMKTVKSCAMWFKHIFFSNLRPLSDFHPSSMPLPYQGMTPDYMIFFHGVICHISVCHHPEAVKLKTLKHLQHNCITCHTQVFYFVKEVSWKNKVFPFKKTGRLVSKNVSNIVLS